VKRKDGTRCKPPGPQLTGPTSPDRPSTTASNHRQVAARPGSARNPPADEEFLARFGDAIDDRVAEIVDELLEERDSARQHRPGRYVSAASLILAALAATAVLRHNPVAWTVWPSAVVISLAAAWTARAGRS
jgi:hypothetical protein